MNIFKDLYANGVFKLNLSDWQKALLMSILGGFALPIAAVVQTPHINLFTVNWHEVLILAENGAIIGGVTYIFKNFFSDNSGRFLGRVG